MISVKKKIQILRKKIHHWGYAYHTKNISLVSDYKYDAVLKELHQLELNTTCVVTKESVTQYVGSMPNNKFRKILHTTPMLSLNNIIEMSQLLSFDSRMKIKLNKNENSILSYCCELKIDGVAISLLYKQGKLIQAATRGNGKVGEDVIKNVRSIKSIPLCLKLDTNLFQTLPYLLEVRGEVFISKSCFEELNKTMISQGYRSFSNSRNIASGSLRQLNPDITAKRSLSFYCYGINYYIGKTQLPDSHCKRLQLCNSWGIPIDNHFYVAKGTKEVLQYYSNVEKIRSNLEYNIDGIVIKVDSCSDQNKLSIGSRAPNWAVAYKFPAESKITKLNKVVFKVGRTGVITPIAYVEPIIIDNVMIKKVNIHNVNEIKRLNLKLGDTVKIKRSGDVIPKILEVVLSKRTNNLKMVTIPVYCPECGYVLKKSDIESSVLRCTARLTCLAQRKAMLRHFSSRKAMNIQGMGEKIIDKLVDNNLVTIPIDFFYLNKSKLLCLNGFKTESIDRLLQSIHVSKKTTLACFIYALGIPNVGEITASNLAVTYKTIENFITTDFQSLLSSQCVGRVVASDIYDFFQDPGNFKNIQDLISSDVGIQWVSII